MAFVLKELEGVLGGVLENMNEGALCLIEDTAGQQLWREQGCLRILELDIDIYCAATGTFQEEEGECEVRTGLHLIYASGTDKLLYQEWDNCLIGCIYNYLAQLGRKDLLSVELIEGFRAVYKLNRENPTGTGKK